MYYPIYQTSIKQVYSLQVEYQQNDHALNLVGRSVKLCSACHIWGVDALKLKKNAKLLFNELILLLP